MGVLEIILGSAVLLASAIITVICLMQEQKPQKNRGRTKEARLRKVTFWFSIVFFVLILFMDIVMPLLTK